MSFDVIAIHSWSGTIDDLLDSWVALRLDLLNHMNGVADDRDILLVGIRQFLRRLAGTEAKEHKEARQDGDGDAGEGFHFS